LAEEGLVEPYVVFTAHENIFARCGPAGDFYRTDPLRLGQELEVYLETEDGWLGIRPPEGSFSWVPANSLDTDAAEKSGVVVDRRAVAWIGTHLGRARKYRWQVQLAEGEQVSIVGKTERDGKDGPELWYRIVPPSGEFRWVHRSQIAETSEALVQMHRKSSQDEPASADDSSPATLREVIGAALDLEPVGASSTDVESVATESRELPTVKRQPPPATEPQRLLDDQPIGSGVAAATYVEPEMSVSEDVQVRDIEAGRKAEPPSEELAADDSSWVTGSRTAIEADSERQMFSPSAAAVATPLRETTPPVLGTIVGNSSVRLTSQQLAERDARAAQMARQLATRVVNADINELQLELSRQMAAGSSAAVVEPIRQRAHTWIQRLNDPVERGRARVLIERVEQYQRVARRREGQAPVEVPLSSSGTLPTPTIGNVAAGSAAPPGANRKAFDREGFLVQVYSARPDSPPFALTDAAGQTLAYVSPSPGLNLRMHLNAKVGLYGQLSYLTGLETPHFIAREAVRISR